MFACSTDSGPSLGQKNREDSSSVLTTRVGTYPDGTLVLVNDLLTHPQTKSRSGRFLVVNSGSKMRGSVAASMPLPLSATVILTRG